MPRRLGSGACQAVSTLRTSSIVDSNESEGLFVAHIKTIERIIASLARRSGLVGEVAEDFASWAKLRLMEGDYAVLRSFRGESTLTTYLTVVIARLAREYRVAHWGRWRPSAAALRKGDLAIRLETLVYRDGFSLTQAAELLRTSGETDLKDAELAVLLAGLPVRQPLRPVEVGAQMLEGAPASQHSDDGLLATEHARERRVVSDALSRALSELSSEDQVILRMRYWSDLGVADIARGLGLPQKPLYRRIESSVARLRRSLERAGITREEVRSVLGEAGAAEHEGRRL